MGNSVKMRDYVLSVSTDVGVTFNPVGGLRTKDLTRENPVADTTNQSDTGNETSSQFTGYGTVTMSGSLTSDTRTAALYALKDLIAAANSADPKLLFKLENAALGIYQGDFNITSLNLAGDQNGIAEYSIALQNADVVTFTAGV